MSIPNRQRRQARPILIALWSMILAIAAGSSALGATITNVFMDSEGNALSNTPIRLWPMSTPLADKPNTISGPAINKRTGTDGAFSVNLKGGLYLVQVNYSQRDQFTISVPVGLMTNDMNDIIASTNMFAWPPNSTNAIALTNLVDVSAGTLVHGDVPQWDSTTEKWTNSQAASVAVAAGTSTEVQTRDPSTGRFGALASARAILGGLNVQTNLEATELSAAAGGIGSVSVGGSAWEKLGRVNMAFLETDRILWTNDYYFAEPAGLADTNAQLIAVSATNQVIKLWFASSGFAGSESGYNYVNYAESTNGFDFTRYDGHCLTNQARPYVIKIADGTYRMTTCDQPGSDNIQLWASTNGIVWSHVGTNIITAAGEGVSWLASMGIYDDGAGTYTAGLDTKEDGSHGWAIKFLTSPDLLTWSSVPGTGLGDGTYMIGSPYLTRQVFTNGSGVVLTNWVCFAQRSYQTVPAPADTPTDILRVTSPDLTNWYTVEAGVATAVPYGMTQILPRTLRDEGRKYGFGQTADAHLIEYNGNVYLYYETLHHGGTGAGGSWLKVAVARDMNLAGACGYDQNDSLWVPGRSQFGNVLNIGEPAASPNPDLQGQMRIGGTLPGIELDKVNGGTHEKKSAIQNQGNQVVIYAEPDSYGDNCYLAAFGHNGLTPTTARFWGNTSLEYRGTNSASIGLRIYNYDPGAHLFGIYPYGGADAYVAGGFTINDDTLGKMRLFMSPDGYLVLNHYVPQGQFTSYTTNSTGALATWSPDLTLYPNAWRTITSRSGGGAPSYGDNAWVLTNLFFVPGVNFIALSGIKSVYLGNGSTQLGGLDLLANSGSGWESYLRMDGANGVVGAAKQLVLTNGASVLGPFIMPATNLAGTLVLDMDGRRIERITTNASFAVTFSRTMTDGDMKALKVNAQAALDVTFPSSRYGASNITSLSIPADHVQLVSWWRDDGTNYVSTDIDLLATTNTFSGDNTFTGNLKVGTTNVAGELSLKAPIASPSFTGSPQTTTMQASSGFSVGVVPGTYKLGLVDTSTDWTQWMETLDANNYPLSLCLLSTQPGFTNMPSGANQGEIDWVGWVSGSVTTAQIKVLYTTSGSTNARLRLSADRIEIPGTLALGTGATNAAVTVATTNGFFMDSSAPAAVGNARGIGAVDLQLGRDSATKVASGQSSFAAGTNNTASGGYSSSVGLANVASSSYSFAQGYQSTAQASSSHASGAYALASLTGQFARSNGRFAVPGDAQMSIITAGAIGTSNTATNLNPYIIAAGTINVPANTTWAFFAQVGARSTDAGTGDEESAYYELRGLIERDNSAAATRIVGSVSKSVIAEDDAAWDVDATADTTNGALKITATGNDETAVRWVATIYLTQIGG